MTKLKSWFFFNFFQTKKTENVTTQNSNCDKNQIVRKRKTQTVTKLIMKKEKKNQILKTKFLTKLKKKEGILSRTTGHLNNLWDILWSAFCNLAMFVQNNHAAQVADPMDASPPIGKINPFFSYEWAKISSTLPE